MKKSQEKTPIVDAIRRYHELGITPFTTPGHKMGKGVDPELLKWMGEETFYNDIPAQSGIDDRRESIGIQDEAEELAAEAYGADTTRFSTNGSSLSAHVAIITVANFGEKILVSRNTHKSMVGAMVMADVLPVYLDAEIDTDFDIQHGITPEHLEKMIAAHPDAKGVFIVSPTYYGVVSDVAALAQVCHKYNIPLIVDEAWGSHMAFCKELPTHALACGADMTFSSIHKTMNGLGQASIVCLKGDRIDEDRFQLCYDLFESTSLSAPILASIDAARKQMVVHGQELWSKAIALSRKARQALAKIEGLKVLDKSVTGKPGAFDVDETKLTLDVRELGLSGYLAADWIQERFNITLEMATHRHLMALITVADSEETIDLLIKAITAVCEWAKEKKPDAYVAMPLLGELGTHQVMSPTKAFFGQTKKISLEKCAGHVIAEIVSPYPPGVPRLIPGEFITPAIVEYLKKGRDGGMLAVDPSDESLKTLRVIDVSYSRK